MAKYEYKVNIYLKLSNFILLFLFVSNSAFSQLGAIKGQVLDVNNNNPISFANIIVLDSTNLGSISDIKGDFIIKNIPPGFYKLKTSVIGYSTHISPEIEVIQNKTTNINIALTENTYDLEEVVVKASPFKKKIESPISMRSLGVSEIEKTPGANRDISRIIQSLPGISFSIAYRNDVIVRGGGPSENAFYIEGIEIPTINHFSTQGASGGPVGIINADFVSELDFYSGAFPIYAKDALSSVIDFKMVNGNKEKFKYKATLGASDLSLTLDGPISNRTTTIFSVRRSYLQFLFDFIGLPFLPTYNDYQLITNTKIDKKNEFKLISLGSFDDLVLNTGIKNPTDKQQYQLNNIPINTQWSYMIGGVYKRFHKNGYSLFLISRNFLNNSVVKYKNNDESLNENLQFDIKSQEIENKLRFEHISIIKGYKFTYGSGYEFSKYNNNIFKRIVNNLQPVVIDNESHLSINSWNLFGQISKGFFLDRLTVSLGLRSDANDYSDDMKKFFNHISPRISLSYAVQENWFINMNVGRYFKRPEYTTLGYKDQNDVLVNKHNKIKYIVSNHYVAGLEWQPEKKAKIAGEFFFKSYDNYPFSIKDGVALSSKGANYGIAGGEEVVSIGEGRAYGFELFVRLPSYKNYGLILSYTYVTSEFKDIKGKYIPTSWDNKNILNLIVRKSFKNNWDMGFKWRLIGGSPYTPYDIEKSRIIENWNTQNEPFLDYSRFNSLRFDPFHQLDIRVDKTYFFNKWQIGFYLDIQNLYNYKAKSQDYLLNIDENGNENINPENNEEYILRRLENDTGNVLPTIGIKIAF